MTNLSPKIEIINHFDNLINNLDIEIELCLEKYNDQQVIGQILENSSTDRENFRNKNSCFNVELFSTIESLENNIWTESNKVIEYLIQVRMRTIGELRKAQEDSLKYYRLNWPHFKSQLTDNKSIDELKSELFREKFYFQVNFTQPIKPLWYFNIFTFVTDFYMSQSDIDSLQKLINDEKEPFCATPPPVFDQKMVLIGLLLKSFIENLSSRFPSQVINVRKHDVLNIESIHFEYDYSGVELINSNTIDFSSLANLKLIDRDYPKFPRQSTKINIEGLSSLKTLELGINSFDIYFSIKNLYSLKMFHLLNPKIDEDNTSRIFDQLQNIEELHLNGNLYYFNLDTFINLRSLSICGYIKDGFNFELIKNLPNQLDELSILIPFIDYETILKILNGHNYSNLKSLVIAYSNIRRIEKKFMQRFPSLSKFCMVKGNVETIEDDAFSQSKELIVLDLRENLLKRLYKRDFSQLVNLEYINVDKNRIEFIENGIFSHMKKLDLISIRENKIENDLKPLFKGT